MGYYPDYPPERRATKREWLALVVVVILVYALIYCMAAAFTGWWPF